MANPENSEIIKREFSLSKNWKKYLFEFLMLLVAVFLGFVAENIREDFAERQQAIELAKSFYEELKNDSIMAETKVQNRLKKENSIRYLQKYFADSSLNNVPKIFSINFIYGIASRTPTNFKPRTVLLDQLSNSGAIRFFKNTQLKNLIGDLSVAIESFNEREAYESSVFTACMEPIMLNHMDFTFEEKLLSGRAIFKTLAAYEHNSEFIPFHLSQIEKINRQAIVNALGYYRLNGLEATRSIHLQRYVDVNTALLKELRKEYNLK
jgi:hypothetical protein